MIRWDLAAVAAGAAWASSAVLAGSARTDSPQAEAVRHLMLAAAGVATAVVYIERSRRRTVAEVREDMRSERKYHHMKLIEVGRTLEAAEHDSTVVNLRARAR